MPRSRKRRSSGADWAVSPKTWSDLVTEQVKRASENALEEVMVELTARAIETKEAYRRWKNQTHDAVSTIDGYVASRWGQPIGSEHTLPQPPVTDKRHYIDDSDRTERETRFMDKNKIVGILTAWMNYSFVLENPEWHHGRHMIPFTAVVGEHGGGLLQGALKSRFRIQ